MSLLNCKIKACRSGAFVMLRAVFICITVFTLVSCGGKAEHAKAPDWYLQPTQNGVIGGVGEAGFHIGGPAAQRQLAISRALDEIASQMGIKISSIQEIRSVETEKTSDSEIAAYSIHSTGGVTVRAQIREFRHDRDRIIVWMTVY